MSVCLAWPLTECFADRFLELETGRHLYWTAFVGSLLLKKVSPL